MSLHLPLRAIAGAALAAFGLLSAACSQAAGRCDTASLRDATCIGSLDSPGAHPQDFSDPNAALPAGLVRPRGSNAIAAATATTVPPQVARNECVAVPFVAWAYDPASFNVALPSFLSPAGSGFLGAGESTGPMQPRSACVSDSDGSCATWVPQSHPFLFLDGSGSGAHFQQCAGAVSSGSVSCPVTGGAAYVTAAATGGWNFSAWMIACKTADMTPGLTAAGADLSWYRNCGAAGSCGFYLVYPSANPGGSAGRSSASGG